MSEEKLLSTLKLMSQHLGRLEDYTKTMRQIRSFEDIEPEREEQSLARLAEKIGEVSAPLNAVGAIRITVDAAKDPSEERIWLDDSLFLEVLENLLSNALRYAKSRVEIFLDYERGNGMLFLYVHDDGSGFDEKELGSAVEPYFRGRAEDAADEEKHFGIGLHICRVIAKKHGGVLNVANGMDGGAFVSVSFFCGKS